MTQDKRKQKLANYWLAARAHNALLCALVGCY